MRAADLYVGSGIDCIEDGEIVTARYCSQQPAQIDLNPPKPFTSSVPEASAIEPGRFKVRLIAAKSARDYARQTPKEQGEHPNGVHCFEGQAISGNTTLVREILHLFVQCMTFCSVLLKDRSLSRLRLGRI